MKKFVTEKYIAEGDFVEEYVFYTSLKPEIKFKTSIYKGKESFEMVIDNQITQEITKEIYDYMYRYKIGEELGKNIYRDMIGGYVASVIVYHNQLSLSIVEISNYEIVDMNKVPTYLLDVTNDKRFKETHIVLLSETELKELNDLSLIEDHRPEQNIGNMTNFFMVECLDLDKNELLSRDFAISKRRVNIKMQKRVNEKVKDIKSKGFKVSCRVQEDIGATIHSDFKNLKWIIKEIQTSSLDKETLDVLFASNNQS